MLTSHILERLQSRNIKINPAIIDQIAQAVNTDSAVLIARLSRHVGDNANNYHARQSSNGDLIYLIVRDNKPVTIMFRRSNQRNNTEGLRVNRVVDISSDIVNHVKVL